MSKMQTQEEIDMKIAREAMIAKRFGGNSSGAKTGGDGTVRRKKKGAHKSLGDDKKLGSVLKKFGLTDMKGLEEVNIFTEDGNVIHITNPKVQASIPSNTYVVSGTVETKRLDELLPGILNQVGEESMDKLRQYANSTVNNGQVEEEEEDDDDDDVPDLVENFEEAAAK